MSYSQLTKGFILEEHRMQGRGTVAAANHFGEILTTKTFMVAAISIMLVFKRFDVAENTLKIITN